MQLSALLAALPIAPELTGRDRPVTGIAYDSRAVQPGMLFVAVSGFTVDGHRFIGDAAARGATAVLVEQGRGRRPDGWDAGRCAWVETADSRLALSALAAVWHGHPGLAMTVIGVTGTDGKTTTASMLAHLLDGGGRVSGMTGTAQFKIGPRWLPNLTRQTTLEAPDVQALLARMRDAGVTHAVVESSSHGLALRKLDHCAFDLAVVTNITADHLDFHGDRAGYLAAKARLLELTAARPASKTGPRCAVLNADDRSFDELRHHTDLPVLSYSAGHPADLSARIVEATPSGTRAALSGRWGTAELWAPLPGAFNVSNALAALTAALALGVPRDEALAALGRFPGVPGRMKPVDVGQPFTVIVDYAHTGHSFRKLLEVLRPLTAGRLIAVFGSAGEQSRERRAGMGAVAAELADIAVITSEDPRFEDPDQIIAEIARVMTDAGRREGRDLYRVTDRREAIGAAIRLARPGDLLVLAGKGHEQSIIVGAVKQPWDEQRVVEEELIRHGRC